MAALQQLANRHYRAGVALRRRTEQAAANLWRRVEVGALDASWRQLTPRMVALLAVAQTAAARDADAYADATLDLQDVDSDTGGAIVPAAFAGTAADGRPLDGLLRWPIIAAKQAIGRGHTETRALASGLAELLFIVRNEVTDARRVADGVAVAARRHASGYVRMVQPPCCPRCAILAGRWCRWSAGFDRHLNCDCVHIPAQEDVTGDLRTDPKLLFESGQIHGLTAAETKALHDGADMARVVNVKRSGITIAGGRRTTTELAGRRRIRLTPEQIYRDATSRDDAIRLLRRFGYIR